MTSLIEYSSDFSYSESLYYSHPDFLIEVTPDPVVINDPPPSGVSGGSQPILFYITQRFTNYLLLSLGNYP
jgi:hypothetical protein